MSYDTSKAAVWEPHPYQEKAVKLMIQQAAAGLLLDPGLGKTSSTLSAFTILKKAGLVNRMLVVAPIKPMYNVWPNEIEEWANFKHLTCAILHGKDKEWEVENPDGVDIFLINPEGLAWLLGTPKKPNFKRLKKLGVDMLVIDESTKFKSSKSGRFKLIKKVLGKFDRRYILTGSVSPNGLMDIWSQIYMLDTGNALGGYITHYRNEYFDEPSISEPFKWRPQEDATERVAEAISPLVLQLNAEDHLDMPDMIFVNLTVELPEDARRIYKEVDDAFISAMGQDLVVAGNAAAAGTKCRQIANGAVYTTDYDTGRSTGEWSTVHDEKLDALDELIDELSGAPLLVLYEFRHDLQRILERYPDAPYLGSGTSERDSTIAIKRFNAGDIPLLLGHPASMGHGINLQKSCHHVCWFGITWNLEFYDQANARVYRQGQKEQSVMIYHICAKNTRDQKVLQVLNRKDRDQTTLKEALISPV